MEDLPVQVLGDHIDQKGSIVLPDKLRFDFTHSGPISTAELGRIASVSSQQLQANLEVYAKDVPLGQAKHIEGMTSVGDCKADVVQGVKTSMPLQDRVG